MSQSKLSNLSAIKHVHENNLNSIDVTKLIRRNPDTNKGTFGSLAIIGGSYTMHGSLYLSGRSSMLCGCGKTTLASIDKNFACDQTMPEILTNSPANILHNLHNFTCLIIGPGLGQDDESCDIVDQILSDNSTIPKIFDADALNIISNNALLQQKFKLLPNKIITPHPKESAKLLGVQLDQVVSHRIDAIQKLYDKYNALTLLKGHESLIYNGNDLFVNQTGNPGMSNAGQGDVLCGIIGAIICQGLNPMMALRLGVYVHGKSADNLAKAHGYIGILPSEVAYEARLVLNQII